MAAPNKRKIMNDPVYGFIDIPSGLIYEIIENSYFQRLRRIKQLGLTYLVYPGAYHTRFQHAIGAMHLMSTVINIIRSKGHVITEKEENAAMLAILLHDIGHGPFSHALEFTIVKNVTHEDLSLLFMDKLNKKYKGKLDLAIKIFKNEYHKKFLHQLVSGQLDVDRLDYLRRDSFFSGVSEGVIGSDRIIKMLDIVNDELVVESKGIYSIEKFLIARRLMYWQVYLHKTVLSAEQLLVKTLLRAKELSEKGEMLFATPALQYFLSNDVCADDFKNDKKVLGDHTLLDLYANLDDYDIMSAIKVWVNHPDKVLSTLSSNMINRNLFKIVIQNEPINKEVLSAKKKEFKEKMSLTDKEIKYFVFTDNITNYAYSANDEKINILMKNNELKDIAEASDMLNISVLSKKVRKYFMCYPKKLD
ncbi:MAG: phosphohydrolase [Bacteroidetes bacterium GWF2_38_335]|nr:MAG: phosphohydrolase [Bacteroidetes bacterium GWF2_38_335]OFY81637.1 MAG: phosphohydrolase [Bacteroidetes bacterium RIFOXYA12_FULL_38_20]HBS88991.1 phosphohydrolase [Bacteroidales bacterium]